MNERFTQAPHHNDPKHAQSPNAALLIDFDNVTMGIRSNLGQELRQLMSSDIIRGKVSVQRAYADWRRYPQYVVPLSEAAIDLIYAPAYGSSKKNATDIRLAIDALELVFTRPEIGTFILLSGDSDFSSLVLKLKEYGKYVIGVGMQESSSDLLVQNCDEYYSYDSLSGLVSADDMDTDRHDPWDLAEHSIRKMVERDDVMRSDRLKQVMLELDPSFDEKEIGYSKFNRFLTEASSRGILQLQKIGNGQYRVGPGSSVDVEGPSGDGGSGPSASSGGESPPPPRDLSEETDGGGTTTQEAPEQQQASSGGGQSGGRSGRDQTSGRQQEDSGRKQQQEQKKDGGRSAGRKRAGGDRPVVEAEQLREAYDLLRDVVSDLSGEDGRVRDSEVKREMLNRDSSFDEGALGFSKFSRFIRQAHDEEVVDIEKDSDGNYYLSVGGGGAPAGGRGQQDRGQQESQQQDRGQQESQQQDRRQGQEPESRSRAEPQPEPEPEPEPEPQSAAESRSERSEPAGDGEQEQQEEDEQDRARRGGGLRRRRKKEDDGTSSDSGDDSWVPGPVDAGGGGGDDESGPTTQPAGSGAGSEESGSKEQRTLGRFRRGSKSGKGKKEEDDSGGDPTPGPVSTSSQDADAGRNGDAGSGGAPASSGPDAEAEYADGGSSSGGRSEPAGELDEIVAHMKDHYSGVGEKTARKLVDEFGEETLSVIDENPRRVEQLLPKHRAEAVLQARAVERQEGGRD